MVVAQSIDQSLTKNQRENSRSLKNRGTGSRQEDTPVSSFVPGRQEASWPKDGDRLRDREQPPEAGDTRWLNSLADRWLRSCAQTPGQDRAQMKHASSAQREALDRVAEQVATM